MTDSGRTAGDAGGDITPFPGARAFNKEVAPAFLDHVCMTAGFAPPPGSPVGEGQGAGFAWCELHCGSAVTATLLAGSNPLGDFHAIDAREMLIAHGRALAKDGGVRNLTLHQAGLEKAIDLSLPAFDYICVSGVYSWVPARERALVLAFLRKFLKPGGTVYVTYNARPGWNRLEPFLRLYRETTRGMNLTAHQRLSIARELYATLEQARAPAILASGITAVSLSELDAVPAEALAADYANDFSEPLYVTEVAADLAGIDCALVGPAEMAESLPVLAAQEPFKSTLARIPTQLGRELAKDMLRETRFRRDVFVRGGKRLSADNREMMLSGLAFALERPSEEIRYDVKMPFGGMRFDNPHAHAVVAALQPGPQSFGELVGRAQNDPAEAQAIVASIHALLVTAQIRPVYRGTREAAKAAQGLQSAIMARAATPDAVGFLPSAFGTAFLVPVPDQLFAMAEPATGADALAAAAIEKLGGPALPPAARDAITRRARAFGQALPYYASIGLRLQAS